MSIEIYGNILRFTRKGSPNCWRGTIRLSDIRAVFQNSDGSVSVISLDEEWVVSSDPLDYDRISEALLGKGGYPVIRSSPEVLPGLPFWVRDGEEGKCFELKFVDSGWIIGLGIVEERYTHKGIQFASGYHASDMKYVDCDQEDLSTTIQTAMRAIEKKYGLPVCGIRPHVERIGKDGWELDPEPMDKSSEL